MKKPLNGMLVVRFLVSFIEEPILAHIDRLQCQRVQQMFEKFRSEHVLHVVLCFGILHCL